jgi:pimeloyl-ACP methyl ester carboxylesterase
MRRALRVIVGVVVVVVVAVAGLLLSWRVPDRPVSALQAKWAPPPSTFLDVKGLQVHLRDEGPRDDPAPIILLHGTSASLHTWDGWTAALSSKRRVIRFDLPGFGLTGPSTDGVYSIERYVDTVVAVADALAVPRFVIAGNSLGGYVAWATALAHPQRVEGLILVDAAGYPVQAQSVPLAFRIARTPGLNRLMRDVLPRSLVEKSLQDVYGDPAKVTPALVDRYFDLATRAGNRAALVARFEQTQPGTMSDRIREITAPTLILWGGRDRLIPPALGDRFAADIRGSTIVVFDTLGHVPHEEDPAATVAGVLRFLDKP